MKKLFVLLFLYSTQIFIASCNITPSRLIGTHSDIDPETLFVFCNTAPSRLITTHHNAYPETFGGFSLFNDPIIKQTESLLKQPLTRATAMQIFSLTTRDLQPQEASTKKLTVPQQFALHLLIEKALKDGDEIINDPSYALTKPQGFTPLRTLRSAMQSTDEHAYPLLNSIIQRRPQHQYTIELKRFQDLKAHETLYVFAKLYRFCSNLQSDKGILPGHFRIPSNFCIKKYLKTSQFDYFFENNSASFCEMTSIYPLPINFELKNIICTLVYYTENLRDYRKRQ